MTPTQLQETLSKFGAVCVGGQLVSLCPLCQQEETDPYQGKVYLTPGSRVVLLLYCVKCGDPENKEFNRKLSKRLCTERGVDFDLLARRVDHEEIRSLWASVSPSSRPAELEQERAGAEELDRAYSLLLDQLGLSERHKRWLDRRGLDSDWALGAGYRTVPAQELLQEVVKPVVGVGCCVDRVPGFGPGPSLRARPGALLFPCRERGGLIGALKQRVTDGGRARLRLLSSTGCGGPKAKVVLHWPLGAAHGLTPPTATLWITEGERKADCHWVRAGVPTLALPGVGFWRRGLSEVVAVGVRSVVLALDRDGPGQRAQGLLGEALAAQGVGVETARWEGAKGLDDALVRGASIERVPWSESASEQPPHPNQRLHPNPRRFSRGQRVRDWQLLDYLREWSPIHREEVNCWQPYLSELIRAGKVRMWKDDRGQVVEVISERPDH